ncbi:hypothetical protein KX928_05590 [Roseobacter sp. YSTF-M11]|uniref:Tetratricopeptide repeat protein n=1 Tax=Roseobacter insulae TaxID=2859783 RepID=A0A9X1FTR7_9RHOB|nr:hypothetical protein [Roseobacter insulae]MBW4707254.1 hypothetical protein [Roseobacter insulae]
MPDEVNHATPGQDTPPDTANAPSRKARILSELAFLRSAVLSTVAVLAVVAVLVVAIRDLTRAPIVLEEIGVTETLSKDGYSGLVTSNMLWDAIEDIRNFTGDSKKNVRIQTASRQLDVVEPGSGLSLQRITGVLRSLFNLPQTRIAGEFVCLASTCRNTEISLRIRIFSGDGTRVLSAGPIGDRTMEAYFNDTALALLEQEIDPLVAARYYYFDNFEDWQLDVARIATQLLLQRGPNAEEAATLLGFVALDNLDYDQAIALSTQAIEVGNDVRAQQPFWSRGAAAQDAVRAQSLLLQGQALSEKGFTLRDEDMQRQAIAVLDRAAALAPDYGFIRTAQARTMEGLNEFEKAEELYRMAVEVDRLDPYAWSDLGRARLVINKSEEAENDFRIARNLAPDDPFLVYYHATDQSLDEALAEAKLWARNAPDDPQAWGFWLDLLDEKWYSDAELLCARPNGSVAELVAVASEIAPLEAREEAAFFAQDACDWSP